MTAAARSRSAVVTLPTDTQIMITREFAAPRHLVFAAWTTPDLVRQWWHAKRGKVTVADIDLRVGGTWRYVIATDRGFEAGFHGEYREIVPHERLVWTEVFEGAPSGPNDYVVNTATFREADGHTTLTLVTDAPSKRVRDMIIKSGMEAGMQDAYDLLDEVASSLQR